MSRSPARAHGPAEGGPYGRVLAVSLPLAASMASVLAMQFVERLFLGAYSLEALAAVAPAALALYWSGSFFLGAVNYLSVFVAQYLGSGRPERVGAVVWAGIYFCLGAGLILAALSLWAEPLFALTGHAPELRELEASYFTIEARGAALALLGPALGGLFAGEGRTRPVMLANLLGTASFVPLAYALINGWGFFPELGLAGAAWATVAAWAVTAASLALMIFQGPRWREFGLDRGWVFDRELMARLLRYGLPSGLQSTLEISAVLAFVLMVGRLGMAELAVTNMVMAIDALAFVPMMGFSVGVSTLVGQALGRGEQEQAREAVRRTLHITLGYLGLVCLAFILFPGPLLALFKPRGMESAGFAPLLARGAGVLIMVAFYRIFSGLGIVCSGALRGAGDIRFILKAMALWTAAALLGPLYLGLELLDQGLIWAWGCFTAYVLGLSLAYAWRFRRGAWRSLRLLED